MTVFFTPTWRIFTIKEAIEDFLAACATYWIASTIYFLPSDLMDNPGKRGYTPDVPTGFHLRKTIMPGAHKTFLIRGTLVTQSFVSYLKNSSPNLEGHGITPCHLLYLTLNLNSYHSLKMSLNPVLWDNFGYCNLPTSYEQTGHIFLLVIPTFIVSACWSD